MDDGTPDYDGMLALARQEAIVAQRRSAVYSAAARRAYADGTVFTHHQRSARLAAWEARVATEQHRAFAIALRDARSLRQDRDRLRGVVESAVYWLEKDRTDVRRMHSIMEQLQGALRRSKNEGGPLGG